MSALKRNEAADRTAFREGAGNVTEKENAQARA